MRKAELSINIIIVAVLALIVLGILIFVFSSKIKIFGQGIGNCQGICIDGTKETGYQKCEDKNTNPSSLTKYTYNPTGDCGQNKVCCNAIQVG